MRQPTFFLFLGFFISSLFGCLVAAAGRYYMNENYDIKKKSDKDIDSEEAQKESAAAEDE